MFVGYFRCNVGANVCKVLIKIFSSFLFLYYCSIIYNYYFCLFFVLLMISFIIFQIFLYHFYILQIIWSNSFFPIFFWLPQIDSSEVEKFISRHLTFRAPSFTCTHDWGRKKLVVRTKVYVRLRHNYKHCFPSPAVLWIRNVRERKARIEKKWNFCSLILVLMSKIRCASKNNFHTSDTSV